MTGRRGVYPGSFDPPTVAHLAVASAAADQAGLDRVDLVLSSVALGKDRSTASVDDRLAVLRAAAATRPWLGARQTTDQLLADIAQGYDAVILGADKWAQVVDPAWYDDDPGARDRAVASLPLVLIAPRPPTPVPAPRPGKLVVLTVDPVHADVSSTAVRAGHRTWMIDEAAAFDRRTGAWGGDPD